MSMYFSSHRVMNGVLCIAVLLGVFAHTNVCQAQKKYDPQHEKVRDICDRAVEFLQGNPTGAIGPRTISALAVVEYYKRYDGAVPTDDPFVESTVKELSSMINGGSLEIFDNRETYFPALALILLAEYDAKKYENECVKVLDVLIKRQMENGAFAYRRSKKGKSVDGPRTGDTSQSQFGALAFFVARQHRLPLDPKYPKKLLQFYVDYQGQNGTWEYTAGRINPGNVRGSNSIHSASLSSVYLLADMLKLSKRVKNMAKTTGDNGLGLPKNVTVYIPPKDNEEAQIQEAWGTGDGPVVKFERGKLSSCKNSGNQWYAGNFDFPVHTWNSYFVYALERYCYFKEQAEGGVGSSLKSWYDDGVDFIAEQQAPDGSVNDSRANTMPLTANTALYVLFLVRASEVISLPPVDTELLGGKGFGAGKLVQRGNGTIASSEAEKSLQGLIAALADDSLDDRQLAQVTEAMKRAIREFKTTGGKSRGEITAFLKTMISEKNYYRRLIAIKFLAGEQDMDNVPALLYAMGDPNPNIALQAHNGLRLTSRKFDTFVFDDKGNTDDNLLELQRLKRKWTRWYLEIRPDAELLE